MKMIIQQSSVEWLAFSESGGAVAEFHSAQSGLCDNKTPPSIFVQILKFDSEGPKLFSQKAISISKKTVWNQMSAFGYIYLTIIEKKTSVVSTQQNILSIIGKLIIIPVTTISQLQIKCKQES